MVQNQNFKGKQYSNGHLISFPIPMTKKYLIERYRDIYEQLERFNVEQNPCLFHEDRYVKCRRHNYMLGIHSPCAYPYCCDIPVDDPTAEFGSGRCQYLSTTGCTVKSIRCKLWFCRHVRYASSGGEQDYIALIQSIDMEKGLSRIVLNTRFSIGITEFSTLKSLKHLLAEADVLGFLVFRGSMKDNLEFAYLRWNLNEPRRRNISYRERMEENL